MARGCFLCAGIWLSRKAFKEPFVQWKPVSITRRCGACQHQDVDQLESLQGPPLRLEEIAFDDNGAPALNNDIDEPKALKGVAVRTEVITHDMMEGSFS